MISFLNLVFLSSCLMRCLVSLVMLNILTSTLLLSVLILCWMSFGSLSFSGILFWYMSRQVPTAGFRWYRRLIVFWVICVQCYACTESEFVAIFLLWSSAVCSGSSLRCIKWRSRVFAVLPHGGRVMVVVNVREACGFVRSMCYHSCLLFLRGSFPSCRIKRLLLVSVVLIVTSICSWW